EFATEPEAPPLRCFSSRRIRSMTSSRLSTSAASSVASARAAAASPAILAVCRTSSSLPVNSRRMRPIKSSRLGPASVRAATESSLRLTGWEGSGWFMDFQPRSLRAPRPGGRQSKSVMAFQHAKLLIDARKGHPRRPIAPGGGNGDLRGYPRHSHECRALRISDGKHQREIAPFIIVHQMRLRARQRHGERIAANAEVHREAGAKLEYIARLRILDDLVRIERIGSEYGLPQTVADH